MKKLRIFTEVHDLAFGIPKAEVRNLEFQWHSEFRTSAHRIAIAIPRAEVWNLEFYWNSEFRTSAHGIPMAIPWAEVRNRHLHGQKFRPLECYKMKDMKLRWALTFWRKILFISALSLGNRKVLADPIEYFCWCLFISSTE